MTVNEQLYARYRTAGFADTNEQSSDEGYASLVAMLPADRQARILDFGCGGGEFLSLLARNGYSRAEGIDASKEQVERCRARGIQDVAHVLDSKSWLRSNRAAFHAIVLNDVLEHIAKPDIIDSLIELRNAVVPRGSVIIKVPNCANVFGLVARYLDFTHEVGFTEHSLRQVLIAAGFREVALSGLGTPWRPTLRRTAYWLANSAYQRVHRAIYVAAVGADAPRILSKLLVARAVAP